MVDFRTRCLFEARDAATGFKANCLSVTKNLDVVHLRRKGLAQSKVLVLASAI